MQHISPILKDPFHTMYGRCRE